MSTEEILKDVPKGTTITLEQAKKLREQLFKEAKGCKTCPNEPVCARFGC